MKQYVEKNKMASTLCDINENDDHVGQDDDNNNNASQMEQGSTEFVLPDIIPPPPPLPEIKIDFDDDTLSSYVHNYDKGTTDNDLGVQS
ncbi:hypothetical protein RFI_15427 [Reticulomyxa filosa]|uniref:Uncharacterized protein n=1 Tax=Reticulomyxa filosa TaxID=46433 RepID=X6N6V6_RETFI|nr:hypothetical protein RFI_15427 [Reticulomyxa filosa]|eukprot:ETO21776.1 hypothetical protein RFI_15427 [Reticulomyxa filosa]